MPVRIYEISKKLGIENKEVLAKAKELGIASAKVASSSLDKITAEFLEQQLQLDPSIVPPVHAAPVVDSKPIVIVSEAPAPPIPPTEQVVAVAAHDQAETARHHAAKEPAPLLEVPTEPTPIAEASSVVGVVELQARPVNQEKTEISAPAEVAAASSPVVNIAPATKVEPAHAPVPPPPPAPVVPPVPRVGDKVGFIQLPVKPGPKIGDKVGSVKLPVRPGSSQPPQSGPRFGQSSGNFPPRPGDNRPQYGQQRGGQMNVRSPFPPGAGGRSNFGNRSEPTKPSEPKFVAPVTGELLILKAPIIVRDLAEQLKRKPFQLIADLMELGVFASVNQAIDEVVAQKISAKYGFRFELEKRERGGGIVHAPARKTEVDIEDQLAQLKPRPPVVTIMGHVDHGKTSLLDVIRKANVAAGEAGGITQHIGAYTISFPHPERKNELQQITFLDTPGHAAFSAMRARGANVTDIVILVVAANDGVMPQTLEALSHAQAAKVPIIVAVNKCDHPAANPMKVRQQLQDKGLVAEEWGGSTIFVDVSALTKQGVDKLLEMLLLQAEVMELKANPDRKAKGNVIESGLEPGGPTATVLVRKGTLRVGDVVICGQYWGKVRALINEEGKRQKEAAPSVALKLLGLNGVPVAGLEFSVMEDEKTARALGQERGESAKTQNQEAKAKVTLETLFATLDSNSAKISKVVVKADTQGSVEAIVEALKKIDASKVSLEIIHSAVGTITESDVILSSASNAIILGFHTRIDNGVSDIAKREGVQIKLYSIIYELIDEVKEAMAGMLDPILREVVIGSAEVRKIFELSKGGCVAGCNITTGRIVKGKVRVMRKKGLIYEGATLSLRRFQDEVTEVRAGMECGIRIDGFNEFQIGDAIECYTIEKVAQKL